MEHTNTPELNSDELSKALLNEGYNYTPASSPGMVCIVRASDMKMQFVNDQFKHYLGYSGSDISTGAIYFTDMIEHYQHDRLINQLNHINSNITARAAYLIYPLKAKNGTLVSCYLYASPMAEVTGERLYYLLLLPDLSKWGMPFTSFETKELFLEQFDGEDFGTFEWIMDVDKVFWSEGVYRIYEVDDKRNEITNLFARAFVHPGDKVMVKEAMRKVLDGSGDLDIEFRIITAKNKTKVIHSLARIIKDENGQPSKLAGSIRDISETRSIENDLKSKVEELNHSNKELEEFAYVASHDMQEPLRKITTFSDRLSDKFKDVLGDDGALYLSRIIASAENMRKLINDLLEFSRISKTVLPFQPVNLNFILRQVKTDLELVIEETETVIDAPKLPVIDAVGSQMKQLFSNIIGNAIKFHKVDTAPLITIEVSELPEEDKSSYGLTHGIIYHKIEVSDNGIGFDSEYAIRIFQVFQRLHGKSEYPGSGIGLAICRKIMDYHHGVIYAQDVPGVGARFVIILPGHQSNT